MTLIEFLLTAKATLALHSNWRMEFGNCHCMADVYPKISRLAAFFFYDVGLETCHCFCLAYFLLLILHLFSFLSFLSSVSLFNITPSTTVCNHNSGDSISQIQTGSQEHYILHQQTSAIMSSTFGIGVPVPKMLRQSFRIHSSHRSTPH